MSRRHSTPRAAVAAALALCSLLPVVLAGCSSQGASVEAALPAPEPDAVQVPAFQAQVSDVSQTLAISGSLVAQTRVSVASKLPGRLEQVRLDIGDAVSVGQVVAMLDAREIDAQVDAARAAVNVAKAALESAEAALANAALEHDRARNLFEKGALPRQRLDGADTAHRAAVAQRDLAEANLAQARAALRRAEEVQRDTTLRSPIAGVVVERNLDAGNLTGPGDRPVVVVADTRVLKLQAGVGELEAGRLRVGMPARVEVQARPGVVYEGRLAAIAPEINGRNRQFAIEVRVPNAAGELLSGMFATARIETARAAAVVSVPHEAVATRDGQRVVLRVADGRVQHVTVTEGVTDERRVQIVSGVSAGDLLVADARRALADGARVRPVVR
jgi:RND family efflux transporter MFP subunit